METADGAGKTEVLSDREADKRSFAISWRRGRAYQLLAEARALEDGGKEENKYVLDKYGKVVDVHES